MNKIQTLRSNYKVEFKFKDKRDDSMFFESLDEAKEYRNDLYRSNLAHSFDVVPKLVMLSTNKTYDFLNWSKKDKWK